METTKRRRISPNEMRNITLSEGTKEYLVAIRMVENGVEVAMAQIATYWGEDNVDAMSEGLLDKLEALREEIIRVMMLQVRENLSMTGRTAI